MKKIILFLIFALLIVPASAQVNLNFTLNIEDKVYYPNDELEVEVLVDNQDLSFSAEDTKLTIEIEDRFYNFQLGDMKAGEKFTKKITLPEFPAGTHTIKGSLNYSGIFEERFIEETFNAFEVAFPPIERYPRNVNVIGFNLPEKLEAGKSYDVAITIKNEGTVGGNMIIEVASLEEFVDEEAFLGPGETKTIDMTINFQNTEVSLIEARVFALINGERYLLVYSGKRAYIVPERKAKLQFDRVDLVDEPDNKINSNDEIKLKVYLSNIGNYPATSVIGTLSSASEVIEIVKDKSNYEAILVGESFGSNDSFVIESKETEDEEVMFNLNVNYIDSEPRTAAFEVPVKTTQSGEACSSDNQCKENEICRNGKCEAVTCECGFVKNKQCVQYECCSNSQCGEFETCNLGIRQCVQKSGCINVIKNGPSQDKFDLLFIGADFYSNSELKEEIINLLDFNGDSGYHGLFSIEPFKSNENKFNVWMLNTPDYPIKKYDSTCSEFCSNIVGDPVKYESVCPERDTTVVLFKDKQFRSCAGGNVQWNSLACQSPEDRGRLILHETGHVFGLADEYIEPSIGNRPWGPNCASSFQNAENLWGDLIGYREVGYYTGVADSGATFIENGGCSYVPENIRPTKNSIMRGHWWRLRADYGPVNERHLLAKLEEYK